MLIYTLFIAFIFILFVNALYLLIFSLAGALASKNTTIENKNGQQHKILFLIPGYKEDAVIINSVESVMAQNYPKHLFDCAVIADDFKLQTLRGIRSLGAEAFELPPIEKRNKANAIRVYLSCIQNNYDACVILDADNLIEHDFLINANACLQNGNKIIQARRIAKNETNSLSRLDALSEIINNHIFRKGQRALGLSASLIGSGMIIDWAIFKEIMQDLDVVSGFDKEMELRLLKRQYTIVYAENIIVYDEKVADQKVYVNQRRRWTYAQIFFLRKNAKSALIALVKKGNIDYFNKVLQFALLPRIIGLGFSTIAFLLAFAFGTQMAVTVGLILCAYLFSFYLAVVKELKINELRMLLFSLPMAFWGMLKAIVTSQKASKVFIHTPHNN